MTFYQWANRRKWWEWWQQVMWLILVFMAISSGLFPDAVYLLATGASFTLANYLIDFWKHRALVLHRLSLMQASVIDEAIKYVPPEQAEKISARHDKLLKALDA